METNEKEEHLEQDKKLSGHFQNRLVGIIVFVALGVIFLPDILDGKKVQQEEQFAEIPLRPQVAELNLPDDAINAVDLSEQQQAFAIEDESRESTVNEESSTDSEWKVVEEVSQPVTATVNQSKPEVKAKAVEAQASTQPKPKAKPKPLPVKEPAVENAAAYTLQLGSFNNAANVRGLVSKLRAGGFNAYTSPATPVEGKLTKVFVGPELSKSKLATVQSGVEKLTKLKGRIVAYNPTAS